MHLFMNMLFAKTAEKTDRRTDIHILIINQAHFMIYNHI